MIEKNINVCYFYYQNILIKKQKKRKIIIKLTFFFFVILKCVCMFLIKMQTTFICIFSVVDITTNAFYI